MMANNGLREMLEQMPTQQLDEMLRAELRKKPVDGSAVRRIMQILEAREADQPVENSAEIQAAWEEYTKQEGAPRRSKPALSGTLLRVASVILMLWLLLSAFPQEAEAAPSLWDRFLYMTDSIFEFFNPSDSNDHHVEYRFETDNTGLQQVYGAVVELGITEPVVPTWLPEGYELVELKRESTQFKKEIHACFAYSSNYIICKFESHGVGSTHDFFKDKTPISEKEFGGITHNVLQNNEKLVAIWMRENIECSLSIECQEDILYKILESIYVMGDE